MSEKIIVTVNEGKVRGVKHKSSFSETEYYSFFGIPYAQPPVGRLRFRDPVKAKPWKGIREATREKDGFIRFSPAIFAFKGSEKNLYVNVHTLQLPCEGEPLRPVIVLIHPGSFFFGSPDSCDNGSPNFFIHNDVVYVTIAYRLHILGFLNLEIPECSGNQGLKDIILALRWIKDNIRFFNGDPDNVTLIGSSSSAAAIHILMLSPLLEDFGLFHKAVLMGMYVFANTVVTSTENKQSAFQFARELGFKGDDPRKLLKFLRKMPALSLTLQNRSFRNPDKELAPIYPIVSFQPTQDFGENPVQPKELVNRIPRTMKIPLMFGLCENESVFGFSKKLRPTTDKNLRRSYRQNVHGWMRNLTDDQLNAVNDRIDSFYLKDQITDEIPVPILINILSDATFSDVYESLIDVISEQLPESVYVYKFEYEGSMTTVKNYLPSEVTAQLQGSCHGTDFCHWTNNYRPKSATDLAVIEEFTKLICNFARKGNPNYEGIEQTWRPTTPQHPCHMRISTTLNMVNGRLNHERMEFWRELVEKFKQD